MASTTGLSVAEGLSKIQASRSFAYVDTAGLTIILFDWLLNIDSEINLIWRAKGVTMKTVYLFSRYVPMVYSTTFLLYAIGKYTESECVTLYKIEGASFLITGLCADLVLTIQTWAVWAKGKYMMYFLGVLFSLQVFLTIGFYVASLKFTHNLAIPKPLYGCYPTYDSGFLPAILVVHTVFDTIILVLMLIRGTSLYWWGKDSRLFRTMYSDGISFYVYNTALSIANVTLLFSKSDNSTLMLMMEGALSPVLACRVLLHIRRKYAQMHMKALPTANSGRIGTIHVQRSIVERT